MANSPLTDEERIKRLEDQLERIDSLQREMSSLRTAAFLLWIIFLLCAVVFAISIN